jgi:hypothetical protein
MPPLQNGGAESEVSRILKERVDRLRAGLEALTRECLEHLPPSASRDGGVRGDAPDRVDSDFLSESVRALASSEDQIALLDRLLEGASRCFSRVCLFIARDGEAHGWSSVGLPETEQGDPAKELVVSLREDSILRAALESREPVRRELSGEEIGFLPPHRPGDRLPGMALAAPLVVQESAAAVLYADDGGDGRIAHDPGCVEVLCSVASLAANRLALLSRPASLEVEARAELHVQEPKAEEGGGLLADTALFDVGSLDDELSPLPPATFPVVDSESLPPEEKLLHEDARRFARLLVSELLLYNEDLVIQGRKQRDIYSKLKVEIDRSRQAYDQRVPRSVSARTDYLREEMVRTLAGGDSTALGPGLAS